MSKVSYLAQIGQVAPGIGQAPPPCPHYWDANGRCAACEQKMPSSTSFYAYHLAYPLMMWSGKVRRFVKAVEPFAVLAVAIKVVFFL